MTELLSKGYGLVTLTSGCLDGARNLVLNNVAHAPTGGRRWYGTPVVVWEWGGRLWPTAAFRQIDTLVG